MSDSESGWFSYSPLDAASIDRLSGQQRAVVEQHRGQPEPQPIGEVHVFIYDSAPGQCEIRFSGPDDTNAADVLPIAIRELESAHAISSIAPETIRQPTPMTTDHTPGRRARLRTNPRLQASDRPDTPLGSRRGTINFAEPTEALGFP